MRKLWAFYDARNRAGGDQIVTRVIWLQNTNPNDLISEDH